jgi:transposase
LSAHLADLPKGRPVEIWFQDEARIGQKNGIVRQWARRGTRPRQPADQRYKSAYLFGAICPARGTGAALALPFADTEAMQLHLDEISRHVARRAHAVLLLDRAGWHTSAHLRVPEHVHLLFLPPYSPELQPAEHLWVLSKTALVNRHFATLDDLEDAQMARCAALRERRDRVRSTTSFHWWPLRIHLLQQPNSSEYEAERVLAWSHRRRRHQADARRHHYRRHRALIAS